MNSESYSNVQELLGLGLASPRGPLPEEILITRSLDEALAYSGLFDCEVDGLARNKSGQTEGEVWEQYISEAGRIAQREAREQAFKDIPEGDKLSIIEKIRLKPKILTDVLERIDRVLDEVFGEHLEKLGLTAFNDVLSSELSVAITNYQNPEKEDDLGDYITMILAAGTLPAGFKPAEPFGEWPNGKLVAYWPHEEEPTFAPLIHY